MKTLSKFILPLICLALIQQSCSTKKDKFLNRNFHALTTKYNVLYNGNIALEKGRAGLNDQYTENFWELLPVERMKVDEVLFSDQQTKNADFELAEDKAIKAIQVHGMNFTGKEKNTQIDEAYLLLGKARYFNQRFVPALGALNNILNKYPTSDKINQVKLWREKANIRLDNNVGAIQNLKKLVNDNDLEDQDLADVKAALAQAYMNLKHKDSALVELGIAAQYTKIKNEKARYHFIRGQLYNEFDETNSANREFDAIIDMHRQIPRAFYINAHLQKSNNFDVSSGNLEAFQDYLTDLEENRENRPFLDKIYYRIAEFHHQNASDSLSEVYYNKSLKKTTSDNYLKALNYETLGNMYFDKNIYKTAGAYYDSTLTAMVEKTKPYRIIKKKRESLDDVIYYEGISQTNDSILYVVGLPKDAQLAYYNKHIEKLKLKAIEQAKQKENALAKQQNSAPAISNFGGNQLQTTINPSGGSNSSFYFYNPTTVAYGKTEFLKLWGNRKLQDNWRLSDQRSDLARTSESKENLVADNDEQRYKPETYIAALPTAQKAIDSILKERNFADYQLGIIYKEKFKELELAQAKLEKLLQSTPEERLILPSKYNLYRIYVALNLSQKAEAIKTDIIQNYPDSRYAEILLNPQSQLSRDKNSPEAIYTKLYRQFEQEHYKDVITIAEAQIKRLEGDDFVPKFEILKASAKGRLYGFEAYKEGINYIALTYPNTLEGKKAQELLKTSIPILAKKEFIDDSKAEKFNLVYQFKSDELDAIDSFITSLNEEVSKITYFDLTVSKDIYSENTTFVVVHGLKSIDGASGFAEMLQSDKKDTSGKLVKSKLTMPYFAISNPNYTIIQRHKNLNAYLQLK